jgi:uncharacterized protein
MSQNYIYNTSIQNKINITTYGNTNLENAACLIFIHGFKGFKDWGFGPFLANYFAENGYFVITFNFSHNGVGSSFVEFDELEKFAQNTYSLEISELNEIIDIYKSGFFGKVNENKIGLIGHSRGGGISIIVGSTNDNVNAFVTWSAIAYFDRFSERQKIDWKNKGYLEILNSRTNQKMRLNLSFLEDLEKNSENLLNIKNTIKDCTKQHLIIHGDQDLAVPVKEANLLYSWSKKDKTYLEIIKGTGHTFDIKHPFEGSSKAFDLVLQNTANFFNLSFREN